MYELPFLILFFLLLAFFMQVDFIFYIAYVCFGLYAWSRWGMPAIFNQLKVDRDYYDHTFLGEEVTIKVEIENPGRWPLPWVQLTESVPTALYAGLPVRHVLSLRGRQKEQLSYTIKAMRRGYYRLGPLFITGGDLFGFNEQRQTLAADTLTVYPRIVPLSQLGLPSRLPFGTLSSQQRLFEDPARPNGVRDYQNGDSLRHINWKVSARQEQLLLKTFQPAISLETAILLNLNQAEYSPSQQYDAPEWAIVVAASLAAHLVKQRQAVGLATNGADPLRQEESAGMAFGQKDGRLLLQPGPTLDQATTSAGPAAALLPPPIPPRPGRAQLMKVLEQLARIEAAPTLPYHSWLPRATLPLSWGVTILAITPRGDQENCHALHQLVKSGYNPVLITVEPDLQFGQVRERARRLGFKAYQVTTQEQLDRWQATGQPRQQVLSR